MYGSYRAWGVSVGLTITPGALGSACHALTDVTNLVDRGCQGSKAVTEAAKHDHAGYCACPRSMPVMIGEAVHRAPVQDGYIRKQQSQEQMKPVNLTTHAWES
jgi:hypothetical protein